MTRAQIKTAVKKNRIKLFYIVTAWLIAARCVARVHQLLPMRLSMWAHGQLFKAEAATGFLLILYERYFDCAISNNEFALAAMRVQSGLGATQLHQKLSLQEIITRLETVRDTISALARNENNDAGASGPKRLFPDSFQRFFRMPCSDLKFGKTFCAWLKNARPP